MVTASRARAVHGIDVARVEEAVRAAERRTSGEIRVAVARFYVWGDVQRAARYAFDRLQMERTRRRNGVLVYVAPWRRRFALLGDVGIHQKVPPTFWRDVAEVMAAEMRRGDVTAALLRAISLIGDELATWFPPEPTGDVNELPDSVALRDRGARGP
jgi:uncharacterized membrane protein